MSETNQASAPSGEQENAGLTVTDLKNFKAIIEISAQRGAFKGQELSQVGSVFDRVNQFLQSVAPKQETTEQPVQQPVPSVQPVGAPVTSTSVPPFSLMGGNN